MRSTVLGKLHMSGVSRLLSCPCHFYSTLGSRWPAVYLYNSSTRAEVFLIGTDHLSPQSTEFVYNVIHDIKPHVVAVELCEKRAKALMSGSWHIEKLGWWDLFAIEGGFRQKIITYLIHNLYAGFACTGFKPGDELRVAIEQGKAIGALVSYIDQDVNVTLKKVAKDLNIKQAWKYYLQSRAALTEQWQEVAVLQQAEESCERLGLEQALLHERNEHMVRNLREMKGSIVGVVGADHVQGMQELWQKVECGMHVNALTGEGQASP